MDIIVSNSTPLIGLASIDQFLLLQKLFRTIYIPHGVYDEVVTRGKEIGGAKREVTGADWINVVHVQDRLAVEVLQDELDLGEAEAIVLARQIKADWVLMDEKRGRRKLTQLGIPKIGTLGILLKAKQVGLLSAIKSDIDKLRELGFSVSQSVVDAVLNEAGEI